MKTFTVDCYGETCRVYLEESHYTDGGRKAFILRCVDTPGVFGILTVNEPCEPLEDDEILVKTWSENEEWVPQVLASCPELFEDTGRRVQCGYVEAAVWKVKSDIS